MIMNFEFGELGWNFFFFYVEFHMCNCILRHILDCPDFAWHIVACVQLPSTIIGIGTEIQDIHWLQSRLGRYKFQSIST